MPASNLTDPDQSSSLAPANKTKSIIIPTKAAGHSNIEEMMMTTAAQIRDLKANAASTSQNVTESVPVPSSEHVAEIVGRQGCKIKALRAKTNTYIKTPVRGEAPMFVITGRKEDVHTAKREIQLAADHFSQIRARRGVGSGGQQLSPVNNADQISSPSSIKIEQPIANSSTATLLLSSSSGSSSSSISVSPPNISNLSSFSSASNNRSSSNSPNILIKPATDLTESSDEQSLQLTSAVCMNPLQPGQIVKKVSVPYQVVGLVVGPKGSTIKRIQQNTNTYIVTPSRDSQPVFEIQGMSDNVEAAKIEIENYIMLRTANPTNASNSCSNPSFNDHSFLAFSNNTSSSNSSTSSYTANNKLSLDYELYNNVIDIIDDLKLISPNSSSLFKSVAAVVNEDDNFSNVNSNSNASNIWSSPPPLSSASSTSSHSQMNNDDLLSFTSLAKSEHRSSISSSSSETSSNEMFSKQQYDLNEGVSTAMPLFMYDAKLGEINANNANGSFDFGSSIMSSLSANIVHQSSNFGQSKLILSNSNDPFLSSNSFGNMLANNNTSLSSSISSTASASNNETALNSLFNQHENLLLNASSAQNDSFGYLSSSSNVATVPSDFNFLNLNQQSQYLQTSPQQQNFY